MSSDVDIFRRLRALEAETRRQKTLEPKISGTSFPTGISAGYLFFRTDLGWWCYYDGARWLTVQEYSASIAVEANTLATNFPGPENRTDYAPYMTRAAVGRFVATTNNGSNYWSWSLRGINAGYSAATAIYAASTNADGASTWAHNDTASITQTPANYTRWDVDLSKTGTPGAITFRATLWWRLIVT